MPRSRQYRIPDHHRPCSVPMTVRHQVSSNMARFCTFQSTFHPPCSHPSSARGPLLYGLPYIRTASNLGSNAGQGSQIPVGSKRRHQHQNGTRRLPICNNPDTYSDPDRTLDFHRLQCQAYPQERMCTFLLCIHTMGNAVKLEFRSRLDACNHRLGHCLDYNVCMSCLQSFRTSSKCVLEHLAAV